MKGAKSASTEQCMLDYNEPCTTALSGNRHASERGMVPMQFSLDQVIGLVTLLFLLLNYLEKRK